MGELYGTVINVMVNTSTEIYKTFTTSGQYTIPEGYNKADIFCVGGGSGGVGYRNGGGGGGGYTKTLKELVVIAGQVMEITIGSGGMGGQNAIQNRQGYEGGVSTVTRTGNTLCSAAGGTNTRSDGTMVSINSQSYYHCGKNGGSGGGATTDEGYDTDNGWATVLVPKPGGSDGSKGGGTYNKGGGSGQNTTTRAWGAPTGTLYAGGGGCGADNPSSYKEEAGSAGGAGGGGKGGNSAKAIELNLACGINGVVNTGGGGGGSGYETSGKSTGGYGGSGMILLKLY